MHPHPHPVAHAPPPSPSHPFHRQTRLTHLDHAAACISITHIHIHTLSLSHTHTYGVHFLSLFLGVPFPPLNNPPGPFYPREACPGNRTDLFTTGLIFVASFCVCQSRKDFRTLRANGGCIGLRPPQGCVWGRVGRPAECLRLPLSTIFFPFSFLSAVSLVAPSCIDGQEKREITGI